MVAAAARWPLRRVTPRGVPRRTAGAGGAWTSIRSIFCSPRPRRSAADWRATKRSRGKTPDYSSLRAVSVGSQSTSLIDGARKCRCRLFGDENRQFMITRCWRYQLERSGSNTASLFFGAASAGRRGAARWKGPPNGLVISDSGRSNAYAVVTGPTLPPSKCISAAAARLAITVTRRVKTARAESSDRQNGRIGRRWWYIRGPWRSVFHTVVKVGRSCIRHAA